MNFNFSLQTTLARIIASSAHTNAGSKFIQLSATTSGVADVKQAVKVATNHKSLLKKKTLLFIDEIHRFNKIQQVSTVLFRRGVACLRKGFGYF